MTTEATEAPKVEEVKQEPVTTVENTSTPEPVKEAPKSEAPVAEKKDRKYVPLDELIKERQRRREAEAKLEEVGNRSDSSDNDLKSIAADLGVDEDTAKKLKKHFGPKESPTNELETLQKKFAKRSAELAQDYPDWQENMSEMTKLFEQDHLVDARYALSQDPEKYYLKAKLLRRQEPEVSRREGAKEVVEKLNAQSMASTESSKNSTPKPNGEPKWTRAKIKALKPAEYNKYREEILDAMRRGQIQ